MNTGKLIGRTLFITGASRGIGKAIALKASKDGANIAVVATNEVAINKAVKEIEQCGGKALACKADIRNENDVVRAIKNTCKHFGGIDILINNASVVILTNTANTSMKTYDLMYATNVRATFLTSKLCLPYLKQSNHAHILNFCPPIIPELPKFFATNCAYGITKIGMSMCVLGMANEFRKYGIGVNGLWPTVPIVTNALSNVTENNDDFMKYCRKPDIMADAAYTIVCQDPKLVTGNFLLDELVLGFNGIDNFDVYAIDDSCKHRLIRLDHNLYKKLSQIINNETIIVG